MSGLSDLLNMLSEPERYAGNWLNRFASSILVPYSSATRTAAQMLDKTVKDPANAWETIEANIPGLSNRVKAKLTALGEDIERKSPAWFPINVTPVEETLLSQELERLAFDIGFVGKTISGIELTDEEQYEYQSISGKLIKRDLERLMLVPEYWIANDVDKDKMLRKVLDTARDWARRKMREEMFTTGATEGRMDILETALREIDAQLGKVISGVPEFSHEEPDIYDVSHELDESYRSLLEYIPESTLKGIEVPTSVHSWYEKQEIKDVVSILGNKPLYKINANEKEGSTYRDFYDQWQKRSSITDEFDLAEFDKKNPDARFGNMSKRDFALLEEYHTSKDKGAFLEEHPELTANPYRDSLIDSPRENAVLALWGDANLLTKEAYDEYQKLIKDLDFPDSTLPKGVIPDNVEAFLLETEEKYRNLTDDIEVARLLDDKVKDEEGLTARSKAIKELKATKIDGLTYADIERKIEAINIGTVGTPTDRAIVDGWIDRGKVVDEFTAGSSEARVWLLDHPDEWKWALDNELLTDDGSDWNEDVLRINVQMNQLDEESEEYAVLKRKKQGYSEGFTGIDDFVAYYNLPVGGFRQERYLAEHPEFATEMKDLKGIVPPDYIPPEEYDDLLEKTDKTPEDLLAIKGYGDKVPQDYIDKYVGYYSIEKPADYPEDVAYYEDEWFLQENMDYYREVYLGLLGNKRKDWRLVPSREVFDKYLIYIGTPEGKMREDLRYQNEDLDYWLLATKKVSKPISQIYREREMTSREKFTKGVWESETEFDKRVAELLKRIGALRR